MGRLISGITLLALAALLAVSLEVSGAGIVNDWYKQQYPIVQEKQETVYKKRAATRCEKKIERYTRLVREKPNDSWYRWRLRVWKSRCAEDSSNNPYIKK